jgi:hypothetical protein
MVDLEDFIYGFFLSVSSVLITIIIIDYVFNIGILVRK